MRVVHILIGLAIVALSLVQSIAFAQWSTDPTVNNPVCIAPGNQSVSYQIVKSGTDTIIIWQDERNINPDDIYNYDIYAQKVSNEGVILWATDGVPICTARDAQLDLEAISDGLGGVIMVWYDNRNRLGADIYAQRVDTNGNTQWITDGVAICTVINGVSSNPKLVNDGANGAIITWLDNRSGNGEIYAQRVDVNGSPLWTANGIAICTVAGLYSNDPSPIIISDVSGGAIIAWEDKRNGTTAYSDIYAQRINGNGVIQWASEGVPICTAPYNQTTPDIISDGLGGAIIAWEDIRNSGYEDIYMQRINTNGSVQWTLNGIAVCTAIYDQYWPILISDGVGGTIVTWWDYRNGDPWGSDYTTDIYTQRVDANGNILWATDGIVVCTAPNDQWHWYYPIQDGSGGMIIAWQDNRSGRADVYAQRVYANGDVWAINGVVVCTASNSNGLGVPLFIGDASGGVIISWDDYRSGTNWDIHAQKLDSNGVAQWTLNGVAISTAMYDQSASLMISDGTNGAIVVWDDWRNGSTNKDIYAQRVLFDGTMAVPSDPSGLIATAASSSQINLVWTDNSATEDGFKIERSIDNVTFTQISTVAAGISTYSDSGLSASATYYYKVRSFNSFGNSGYTPTAWATTPPPPLTPPADPSGLTVLAVSSAQIDLTWVDNSSNEDGFAIERGTDGLIFSQIATVLAGVTSYSDIGLPASTTYYYRVRAFNSAGNSGYTNTASAMTSNNVAIVSDAGVVINVVTVDPATLATPPPANITVFPFQMYSFDVTGLGVAASIHTTITLTSALTGIYTWYWYNPTSEGWMQVPDENITTSDNRVFVLRLVDGSFGDADGIANGAIHDPIGPALVGGGSVGGSGGGGGCYIATAVYESREADEVRVLSAFRDKYLLTNVVGRSFIRCYYKIAPALANHIIKRDGLKRVGRSIFVPIVHTIKHPSIFIFLLVGLLIVSVHRIGNSKKVMV